MKKKNKNKNSRGVEREKDRERAPNPEEASRLQCSKSTSTIPDHGHAITQTSREGGGWGSERGRTGHRQDTAQDASGDAPAWERTTKPAHTPTHQAP